MFWKDSLARKILAQARIDKSWLLGLQSDYPSLRVKTIDAKGVVPVIQLSEHGAWMKPQEWAINHVAALKQRYREQHARLINVGSDPSELCSSQCAAVLQKGANTNDDLSDVDKLRKRVDVAERNYVAAMDLLVAIQNGEKLSLQATTSIIEWKQGNRKLFF